MECLFCKIVKREIPAKIFLEDDDHIAFLTPFPNTIGFSVVATKIHYDSYIFALPSEVYHNLLQFSKTVGLLLDKSLEVKRTGLIFEGMGINHAHTKLIPMHGIPDGVWKNINSDQKNRIFYNEYPGFIASHDGPEADSVTIQEVYNKIISCQRNG